MVSPRNALASSSLIGMRAISRVVAGPAPSPLQQSYVLTGPLRGDLLAFPKMERPAMALGIYEHHVVDALHKACRQAQVVSASWEQWSEIPH